MSLYPKLMTRAGAELTVHGASEQGDREAEGWTACDGSVVTEAVAPMEDSAPTYGAAEDGTGDGPTEGPAHDDTHVKRSRKKK